MKRSFEIAVRGRAALALVAVLATLASSCAYYNTFYLARKYYDIAALRQPYVVDRSAAVDNQNFNKSIDYSKKVIGQYPKSKWVDDAYLLWARSLLGKEDPRQTVTMLQDFDLRYPKSPLRAEAKFYLGVAYRRDHKHAQAARTLEEFVTQAPRHELAPYAHLERARALRDLEDYTESAAAATRLLERWPNTTRSGWGSCSAKPSVSRRRAPSTGSWRCSGTRSRTKSGRSRLPRRPRCRPASSRRAPSPWSSSRRRPPRS